MKCFLAFAAALWLSSAVTASEESTSKCLGVTELCTNSLECCAPFICRPGSGGNYNFCLYRRKDIDPPYEGDLPTEAPVTEAPVTEAPVTEAPVTEAPVTEAPVAVEPTCLNATKLCTSTDDCCSPLICRPGEGGENNFCLYRRPGIDPPEGEEPEPTVTEAPVMDPVVLPPSCLNATEKCSSTDECCSPLICRTGEGGNNDFCLYRRPGIDPPADTPSEPSVTSAPVMVTEAPVMETPPKCLPVIAKCSSTDECCAPYICRLGEGGNNKFCLLRRPGIDPPVEPSVTEAPIVDTAPVTEAPVVPPKCKALHTLCTSTEECCSPLICRYGAKGKKTFCMLRRKDIDPPYEAPVTEAPVMKVDPTTAPVTEAPAPQCLDVIQKCSSTDECCDPYICRPGQGGKYSYCLYRRPGIDPPFEPAVTEAPVMEPAATEAPVMEPAVTEAPVMDSIPPPKCTAVTGKCGSTEECCAPLICRVGEGGNNNFCLYRRKGIDPPYVPMTEAPVTSPAMTSPPVTTAPVVPEPKCAAMLQDCVKHKDCCSTMTCRAAYLTRIRVCLPKCAPEGAGCFPGLPCCGDLKCRKSDVPGVKRCKVVVY